jgi:phospholipid/cholesterol/gamma-HCH transport system permease protein
MRERLLNIYSLGVFQYLGRLLLGLGELIEGIGSRVIFLGQVIVKIFYRPFEVRELIIQLYLVGVQSLGIVAVSGFFVGGIVALQFSYALNLFGAGVYLGGVTTSGLLREVGPVLVAIMITGRIGAFIAAELGTMKVTGQAEAIRGLGLDPLQVLVVPRFLAVVAMIFLLTIFGLLVSLIGGAAVSFLILDVNLSYYFVYLLRLTTIWAFLNGMIKSFIFGILVATISCYEGFNAEPGAQGVGRAVNRTLVYASIVVFLTDYMVAAVAALTFTLAEKIVFPFGG